MDVNYIRLTNDDEDDSWSFILCKSDNLESDILEFSESYDTAGGALDAALKWCEDRGLTLNWFVPMGVINKGQIDNVVQASERFKPTSDQRHPSRFTS